MAQDPHGDRWTVKRRWLPWRRRFRGALTNAPDFPSLGDDPVSIVIGIVLLIVMLPFLILALIGAIEIALVLLLLPFALLARVAFGRHWYVEVWLHRAFVEQYDGGGFAASGELVRNLAAEIRAGRTPS
jgi:hypothetical protein